MLSKQHIIIGAFLKEPWKPLTHKQVKVLSGNKSDNYVHYALKALVNDCVLKEEKIGNNKIYLINGNIYALNAAGFVAEYRTAMSRHIPHKNIQNIANKIKTSFFSLIITGSYAKNRQHKNSDIDIVVICDNGVKPGRILSEIKFECEMMIPPAHPYVFTESQFYEMLANKEENYGKETARNNMVIMGGRQYYNILMRAVENGFRG